MSGLKTLRTRIASVKSTQKITTAMKLVAAAKLRRAQEQAEAARPYAQQMEAMLARLAGNIEDSQSPLLVGTGKSDTVLLVIISADRGLCGAYNSSIIRATKAAVQRLQQGGKTVKIFCIGKKARDALGREYARMIVKTVTDMGSGKLHYSDAQQVAQELHQMFAAGEFDVCSVIFNKFRSVISQEVTEQQLIPLPVAANANQPESARSGGGALYLYEPSEAAIVETLLPLNLSVQVFRALLESNASEQGARMTAMDNATRNAGEMIKTLRLRYNRTRQAMITKELIEIISGAEAL